MSRLQWTKLRHRATFVKVQRCSAMLTASTAAA